MLQILEDFFSSQFNGPVTVEMIAISLIVSFIGALLIILIYRKTFTGVVYNHALPLSIVLLSMVAAMIIRTINSNLSLSLGMVGALSIVRFRTAVKDPVDTAFMFWAITLGIMSGAGLYAIALFGSLVLGLCYYLYYLKEAKAKSEYLLVISYQNTSEAEVEKKLEELKNKKLKSRTTNSKGMVEATYEIAYQSDTKQLMDEIQKIIGVHHVNVVAYNTDFGF
ncbi:MAG: DUF4956 domain-containing protein [Erysipelotrichaceae bacterium]|nr:DUF4956 domain-containing protein [Erysipelotrichaceae bacterium]